MIKKGVENGLIKATVDVNIAIRNSDLAIICIGTPNDHSGKLNMNGMCWQVLDWNTPAINFYKKYNAEISNDWLDGKLTNEQVNYLTSLK